MAENGQPCSCRGREQCHPSDLHIRDTILLILDSHFDSEINHTLGVTFSPQGLQKVHLPKPPAGLKATCIIGVGEMNRPLVSTLQLLTCCCDSQVKAFRNTVKRIRKIPKLHFFVMPVSGQCTTMSVMHNAGHQSRACSLWWYHQSAL